MTNREWLCGLSNEEFYDFIQYKLTSISRYVSKEKRKKCFCKWLNAEYLQINIKAEEVKEANNDE